MFDYTRDGIRRSLDESLVRLNTDHVEILMLHDADQGGLEREGFETALPALVELREEGVVKAIGCGMNEWEMTSRFVRAFDLDFILLAGRYTLLEQGALDTFLPLCVERGVKIAVGGPYNSGILARDLDKPVSYNYEIAPQSMIDRAKNVGRGLPSERGGPQGGRNPVRRCASRRRDGDPRRYDPGRVGTEPADGAGAHSVRTVGRPAFGKPDPPGCAHSLTAQVRFTGVKAVIFDLDDTLTVHQAAYDESYLVIAEEIARLHEVDPAAVASSMPGIIRRAGESGPQPEFVRSIGIGGRDLLWGEAGSDRPELADISKRLDVFGCQRGSPSCRPMACLTNDLPPSWRSSSRTKCGLA